MLAFVVEIDGKPVARAGLEDWALLSLTVTASRDRGEGNGDDLRLRLGGLTLPDRDNVYHHVRWGEAETLLSIENQVVLRIVDTDVVDTPAHHYRSDREVQESSFTEDEIRQLRYRDYLELKEEFESNGTE